MSESDFLKISTVFSALEIIEKGIEKIYFYLLKNNKIENLKEVCEQFGLTLKRGYKMSVFEKLLEEYKTEILGEADPNMAGVPAPAPAPAPEMGGGASPDMGAAPAPEGPSAEDVVDELEKQSKRPFVDLAGTLARAMEYNWTSTDIDQINASLPGGITIQDFIDESSTKIKDKNDPNIISSAVTFFDLVDKTLKKDDMEEITPAEQR